MLNARPNYSGLQFGQDGGIDFTSTKGPGDDALPSNEISGYSLVSRLGEVVINAFVDTHEWSLLKQAVNTSDVVLNSTGNSMFETRPAFAEWATVLPGMICVARKHRTDTWRRNLAAETATPVVGCAACMGAYEEFDWFFAGICRSKSIIPSDDGIGPQTDEFFTLAIGGMFTLLNTSGERLSAGDYIQWTMTPISDNAHAPAKKARLGPRRIGIKRCYSSFDSQVIGRVMTFSKPGEPFDVLIKQ